jgi:DNA-binding MarR family transcriptional regulator
MISERLRTAEGEAATEVVLETFRIGGLLLTVGSRLAAREGLTPARWQVLGAVTLAGRPLTVPQVARRMGLTRQAVQASVNRLLDAGLVEVGENLDHRRSPLVRLTELGRQKYAAVDRLQARWINELSAGLKPSDLESTARLLHDLSDRLETMARTGQREDGDDDAT